jgi:hypothetical protein
MIDKYDLFYYESCNNVNELRDITNQYDLFISAYNKETMVTDVYNNIDATKKIWLLFPDYEEVNLAEIDGLYYLNEDLTVNMTDLEMEYINSFIYFINLESYNSRKICIDITGFVKPYMIYLLIILEDLGFTNIDILYSEPNSYENKEETEFSKKEIICTRSVNGFDGRPKEGLNDLFIINVGYDSKLTIEMASFKKEVKKREILLGFPSLQPIMYQENILNLEKASDELSLSESNFKPLLAPANNPFETAKVINDFIREYIKTHDDVKIIYLAPLATKAQTLGMVLFYLFEKQDLETNKITVKFVYPFTKSYSSSAGEDLFRINKYEIDFHLINKLCE